MCLIFFIHSSFEGDLICFQVLDIKNNDAMNIVEKCLCSMIKHILGIYQVLLDPEVG